MATRVTEQRSALSSAGGIARKAARLKPSSPPPAPAKTPSLISDLSLKELYVAMLHCRLLDAHIRQLLRQPRSSRCYASSFHQEAVFVGAGMDLRLDDWVAPAADSSIPAFVKGLSLAAILEHLGPATTSSSSRPHPGEVDLTPVGILPAASSASAQVDIALGIAFAQKKKSSGGVVVTFIGGKTPATAAWREALHYAARHTLPILLVTWNDAFAGRAPAETGHRQSEPSHAAAPVIPVDSKDVVAIYRVAHESIHKARHGGGPTLIEAVSFPASSSPALSELLAGSAADPIGRMEEYLSAKGLFSPTWKQRVTDQFSRQIEAASRRSGTP